MLSVKNLRVEFAAKPLFSHVSFFVNKRDRIALVGKNGVGKSTLLKVIAGLQRPTEGTIAVQKGYTIGYLPQVMKIADERTVEQEAETAFASLNALEENVARLQAQLERRTDYDCPAYMELVEAFTHESERLSLLGSTNRSAQIERTLIGLGFERSDFGRSTKEFSGGWRMRIELAKILLRNPDIILLDEPTNHLDIESIRWLESFITHSAGAVILVSHDRAFINNITNRTLEISCGRITDYRVPYNEYVQLRTERREQQLRAYENQQKEIAETRDFIERFRYKPSKAVQVQSRIKQLEKIVPIEVDEVDKTSLRLKFPPCSRSGDFPLICEDVAKAYGNNIVFSGVNLTLRRGEKVAFVGRNGEGKSTLVKCIMGEINFEGNLRVGHNVQIGYYAQNQAQLLDGTRTVYDTIDYVARGEVRTRIRDILGVFMFGGEASEKKVSVLSGGERSRLAMIKLLLEPVNFLILDEPTNHLDLRTKDVLKEAIRAFDGTVVLVSHDRDFLNGLVDRVYAFSDGKVREHIGGIYDYLATLDATETNLSIPASPNKPAPPKTPATKVHPAPMQKPAPASYAEQKEQTRLQRKAEKAVADKEALITKQEEELKALETRLSTPECAADAALFAEYEKQKRQLDYTMAEWEMATEALETLKAGKTSKK